MYKGNSSVKQYSPRYNLIKKGGASLSDIDLLQVIIGNGCKASSVKKIAKDLNAAMQDIGAENITLEDVKAIKGIGDAKASMIFATLEFWRRKFVKQTAPLINSPEAAAEQVGFIRNKKQEYFVVLTLDGARRLINCHTVTIGTLMSSLVHPREVFALAVEERAASIIIAHNHPSGQLDISEEDRDVTKRIRQAGELMGIRLDDHIVVGGDGFMSVM